MTDWLIDAHAHMDDEAFDEDRDAVLKALREEGVLAVVNPGFDLASSKRAIALANAYENVFANVGSHPHEARFYDAETEAAYLAMTKEKKVIAIGEIGLDYHYDYTERGKQRSVFERQLALAEELDMPVVIHTREAIQDTYDIMKNFGSRIQAVMHSFSESIEMSEKFLDFGYYISLGGIVTFKNAKRPPQVAAAVPIDRLLIETDAPYLAPVPKRGRRNEPKLAFYTAEKMAELRGMELSELLAHTTANAARAFRIEKEIEALTKRG